MIFQVAGNYKLFADDIAPIVDVTRTDTAGADFKKLDNWWQIWLLKFENKSIK